MNLSARLRCAADLVRSGAKTVDIGTDHAYLPAYLVLSGRVDSAIACDIGEGPLANARETVKTLGLDGKIDLRLSDGLSAVKSSEADDICICGMGGELIAQIIDSAEWLTDPKKRLIIQPMTAVDDLRIYLAENGFCVTEEKLIKDAGRIYCIMSAQFGGKTASYTPEYPYIGNISADTEIGREYITKQLVRINKHINMLSKAADKTDIPRLTEIKKLIEKRLGD